MLWDFALSQNCLLWNKWYINETKDCPLDLPKTNYVSCLTTIDIETSQPVANSRRNGQSKAGFISPGAHISENIKTNFQIDIVFINELHILDLNNYIVAS